MSRPQQQQQQHPRRIAVAQMTSTSSRDANFAVISRLAREAREAGASMLFLPENCCLFCETAKETLAATRDQSLEQVLQPFRDLARQHGLWLSLGGVQERIDGDEHHIHNTHVVLRSDGTTAGKYRKIHLFTFRDDSSSSGAVVSLDESASTRPGDSLCVVHDAPCGPLGLSVCYDLRFPDIYQRLTFDLGAQVLAVPAAFSRATGAAGHWEALLRARAVECQACVVAAAQAGVHNAGGKRASWGQAMVVDAWGKVLAEMEKSFPGGGGEGSAGTAEEQQKDLSGGGGGGGGSIAVVDLPPVEEARRRLPIAEHRAAGRRQLGL